MVRVIRENASAETVEFMDWLLYSYMGEIDLPGVVGCVAVVVVMNRGSALICCAVGGSGAATFSIPVSEILISGSIQRFVIGRTVRRRIRRNTSRQEAPYENSE